MKKFFEKPQIDISMFEVESIRTDISGETSAVQQAWKFFEEEYKTHPIQNKYILK